jgi:hypothetical protein
MRLARRACCAAPAPAPEHHEREREQHTLTVCSDLDREWGSGTHQPPDCVCHRRRHVELRQLPHRPEHHTSVYVQAARHYCTVLCAPSQQISTRSSSIIILVPRCKDLFCQFGSALRWAAAVALLLDLGRQPLALTQLLGEAFGNEAGLNVSRFGILLRGWWHGTSKQGSARRLGSIPGILMSIF